MIQLIQGLDDTIIRYVYDYMHTPILDKIMIFITSLGNIGAIWIALTLLFLLFKQTRKLGVLLAFGLILELFICDGILKNIFQRPRPFTRFEVEMLVPAPRSFSFPSGHTASSFTAALIILSQDKKIGVFALILATLIGFSRIYLFCHYPSDVLAGIVLGIIITFVTLKAFKFYESKARV